MYYKYGSIKILSRRKREAKRLFNWNKTSVNSILRKGHGNCGDDLKRPFKVKVQIARIIYVLWLDYELWILITMLYILIYFYIVEFSF